MQDLTPEAAGSDRTQIMFHDIRFAFRLLWRESRHTLSVCLTMALAIGATTLLFAVTYGVLMKPLPWPNADRLVLLNETRGGTCRGSGRSAMPRSRRGVTARAPSRASRRGPSAPRRLPDPAIPNAFASSLPRPICFRHWA